jgi:hypothetical protein
MEYGITDLDEVSRIGYDSGKYFHCHVTNFD